MLVEPICPHEQPSPLDLFRVLWLRSQLSLLVLLQSTSWPSGLGVIAHFQRRENRALGGATSIGWAQQASGGRAGHLTSLVLSSPAQQDLAFVLQGLMGNMGEPGLKGDKVI